jgi:YVTN family beta-propeller protein
MPRRCLCAALLLCCLIVATGHAQYVEDSIDVGGAWVGSLAYNSREDVLYGRCQQASIFFAISCDSNKVINSFPLGRPRQMTYDATDNKAYCPYEGTEEESLAVIDGRTHTLVKSIRMPGATTAVWDSALDRVYVSCQSTNKVAVVDCATDSLLTYISVGACPLKMYINTLRRKLYVLNYDNGTVSIVNMTTNQVIKTVDVGGTPNAGYYCRGVDKFYSGGEYRKCIVISGHSDTIVARIPLPGNVDVMSVTGNEEDGLVYVGAFAGTGDYVATVSSQNDSIVATTAIGRVPYGLTYYASSGFVYCASALTDEVCVLTSDGAQISATLDVGDYPYVFVTAPRHNRLYLGHLGGTHVYVLRDTSAGIAEPQSPRPEFNGALSAAPNPFRGYLRVQVKPQLAGTHTPTEVRICAADGRVVGKFRLSPSVDGTSSAVWDGRDLAQIPVPAGVYVVTTNSGDCLKVIKAGSGPNDRHGTSVIRGGRHDTWSDGGHDGAR